MKIAVTGPDGYIGKALVKTGAIPINCDVNKYFEFEREVRKANPDIVIHLASKTGIEECEDQGSFDIAYSTNVLGVHNVGSVLEKYAIPGVFISSYHVWRGGILEKHREDSKLTPAKNRYGMMKVAGEFVAKQTGMKVIRTSYVFDKQRLRNRISLLEKGKSITEPAFMKRSFIHLNHFTRYLIEYSKMFKDMPETLHLASVDSLTWYVFMRNVAESMGYAANLVRPALFENRKFTPRPWNGALDVSKSIELGFFPVTHRDGLLEMSYED